MDEDQLPIYFVVVVIFYHKRPVFLQSCLAIIVSYNPDLAVLQKQIRALLPQVDKILLIDNASDGNPIESLLQDFNEQELSQISRKQFSSNQGVAIAYNDGINSAREASFSHVLLMDQDSIPEPTMVDCLYLAEASLLSQGITPAALGANYADRDDNKTIFIDSETCPVGRHVCTQEKQLIACDHLISSGSLIPLSVLNQVGLMDEALFVDLVDVDWGLRAQSAGYRCYAVCNALMHHSIGDDCHLVKLVNRKVNIHSSLRYYYQFRNSFLLYKQPYTSWCWIRYHFTRHIVFKFIYCLLFTAPRLENMKMMLLGIYHGLIGKGGKLQ